jgi:alanine dehydrogenase
LTYLHLAVSEELTCSLQEKKLIGIAYETVQSEDGFLPLLFPMSEIAGRMAPQEGAKYLEGTFGGRGI